MPNQEASGEKSRDRYPATQREKIEYSHSNRTTKKRNREEMIKMCEEKRRGGH